MTLTVGGAIFELAQSTPTHLYLRRPAQIPLGAGELTISIDGSVTRQSVELLNHDAENSLALPFQRIG